MRCRILLSHFMSAHHLFFFSYHLRRFPSGCIFIPAIQFSISFGPFHLSSAASPRPQLNSIAGIFLLRNTHVTITFECDRAAVAAVLKVASKPRCLGPCEMLQPARAFLDAREQKYASAQRVSLCLSLLLCADTF